MLRANAKPGETVLVHGASGAVGTAAVQIARSMGLNVVGTAGTKDGMDVVSRCGAHHVFNHNHKSYEKKMVDHLGTGFDVIIEHLANINLGHDLQVSMPSRSRYCLSLYENFVLSDVERKCSSHSCRVPRRC